MAAPVVRGAGPVHETTEDPAVDHPIGHESDTAYVLKQRIERSFAALVGDEPSGSAAIACSADAQGPRPWDREAFAARVRTYAPERWLSKPAALSPLRCALLGWRCTARDELTCETCSRVLVVRSRADPHWTRAELADAFVASLASAHAPSCPWPENPSPQSFARPAAPPGGVPEFAGAVGALARAPALPALAPHWGAADAAEAARLVAHVAAIAAVGDSPRERAACVLALTGWQLGDHDATLTCAVCQRSLGLWNFARAGEPSDAQHSTAAPAVMAGAPLLTAATGAGAKRARDETDDDELRARKVGPVAAARGPAPMDPVREHRWYCPYASTAFALARAQGAPSAAVGGHLPSVPTADSIGALVARALAPRDALLEAIRRRRRPVDA